jgi:3-methyladenine DNA glycosylase/8-oxoguanine DNA glycosylase
VAVKANADAIERMIRDVAKNYGYAREDLVSDRLRWTELTPAEWHDADEQVIAELKGGWNPATA